MEDCQECRVPLGFRSLSDPLPFTLTTYSPRASHIDEKAHLNAHSALIRDAFGNERREVNGLGELQLETAEMTSRGADPSYEVVDAAVMRYNQRQANCLAVGISNGIRGAVVGSVFGGAMALSTAVQSGYRGTSAATYAGMGAMRNAAGFASWTGLYGFSRCGLVRMRGTHDLLNPTIAGGFTGGILTLAASRGHWRFNQSAIFANAAGSAMIAVMFEALSYM